MAEGEEMSGGSREQLLVEALSGGGGQRSLFQVILGVMDPPSETADRDPTPPPPDRIVLVNPVTQGMVVLQGNPAVVAEILSERGLGGGGAPPASMASIEAMRKVDADGGDPVECAVCLEGLGGGGGEGEGAAPAVSEMPCAHRFHETCIVKWLGMNGSCPVCRFQMPAEEDGVPKKGDGEQEEDEEARRGRRRRGLWLTIVYSRWNAGSDRPSSASVEGEDGGAEVEVGVGGDDQADQ